MLRARRRSAVAGVQLADGRLLAVHLFVESNAPRALLQQPHGLADSLLAESETQQQPDLSGGLLCRFLPCLQVDDVCLHGGRAEVPRRLARLAPVRARTPDSDKWSTSQRCEAVVKACRRRPAEGLAGPPGEPVHSKLCLAGRSPNWCQLRQRDSYMHDVKGKPFPKQ